jgi:uncharacterized protein YicC (UPF0701 family)
MIYPYWVHRPDLDDEIRAVMGMSELSVFYDEPHNCIHVMRGDEEFTSALYPLNDAIRNDLRQQAYLLHNALDADERQKVKEANEKMDAYSDSVKAEAEADLHDFNVWEYRRRFEGLDVTPMIIVPEVPK